LRQPARTRNGRAGSEGAIAPHDNTLFAALRALHGWLALALFAVVLLHLAAALFHGLIRRDGVFSSMARGGR
jgi:cytochrome b561